MRRRPCHDAGLPDSFSGPTRRSRDPVVRCEGATDMRRDEVIAVIYEAIRRANELRAPGEHLECAEGTTLYGPGALDSLGLVSLILDVEQAVAEQQGSAAGPGRRARPVAAAQPVPGRGGAGRLRRRPARGGPAVSGPPAILITGTRKGIGLALARHYLAQGVRVVGCSRGPAGLEDEHYEHHRLDVGDEEAVGRLLAAPARRAGDPAGPDQQRGRRGDEPRPADADGDRRRGPADQRRRDVPALPRGGQAPAVGPPRPDRQPDQRRRAAAPAGRGDLRRVQGRRRGADPRPGPRAGPLGHHLQRRRPHPRWRPT